MRLITGGYGKAGVRVEYPLTLLGDGGRSSGL